MSHEAKTEGAAEMPTIQVTSQKEWDSLPDSFGKFTTIEISSEELIRIKSNPGNSETVVLNILCLNLEGYSKARLLNSSSATLFNQSFAWLTDSSSATLHNNSSACLLSNSSAKLFDSSYAELQDKSHAQLYSSSSAKLYHESSAKLYSSSSVTLRGYSSAKLCDESSAMLYGESSARLYGKSSARLYDSSFAELYCASFAEVQENGSAVLFERSMANVFGCKKVIGYENSAVNFSTDPSTIKVFDSAVKNEVKPKEIDFKTWLDRGYIFYKGRREGIIREYEHTYEPFQIYETLDGYFARKRNVIAFGDSEEQAVSSLKWKLTTFGRLERLVSNVEKYVDRKHGSKHC